MDYEIPIRLRAERDALIAEINESFRDVTREGGISWSESEQIDHYEDAATCAAARKSDLDTHWTQLVDDPKWRSDPGIGGFSFLDPIGMRYYAPAAIQRVLRQGYDAGIRFHLGYTGKNALHDWRRSTFALFDDRQRQCVAEFLSLMARWEAAMQFEGDTDQWLEALNTGWNVYLKS
jgi:hypothetical protein